MDQKKGKEPYEKPVLETIPLKADEILAAGCKTTSSPASVPSAPPPCGIGICRLPGS